MISEWDMNKVFKRILNNYLKSKKDPYGGNQLGDFVRNQSVKIIKEKGSISDEQYHLEGSVGKGNWAEIPWIAIFDKSITKTATKGYYIVYLFRADMSGFYLSLNQGWTYFKERYKGNAIKNIRKVTGRWKEHLRSTLDDFSFDEIDLHGSGKLGKGYEFGHICGKFYDKNELPSDSELINDLRNLLGVYREIKGNIGTRTVEEINSSLISKSLAKLISTTSDSYENKVKSYHQNVLESKAIYTIEKPQEKKTAKDKLQKNYWERDPRIAKASLAMSNFKCEIDPKHFTFTSQVTGESYVEAHHLIPMKVQEEFEYSLDVTGNIISLCPNCHRAIHHATLSKKKEMINKLYLKRRDILKKFGISVSFDRLFEIYKHM